MSLENAELAKISVNSLRDDEDHVRQHAGVAVRGDPGRGRRRRHAGAGVGSRGSASRYLTGGLGLRRPVLPARQRRARLPGARARHAGARPRSHRCRQRPDPGACRRAARAAGAAPAAPSACSVSPTSRPRTSSKRRRAPRSQRPAWLADCASSHSIRWSRRCRATTAFRWPGAPPRSPRSPTSSSIATPDPAFVALDWAGLLARRPTLAIVDAWRLLRDRIPADAGARYHVLGRGPAPGADADADARLACALDRRAGALNDARMTEPPAAPWLAANLEALAAALGVTRRRRRRRVAGISPPPSTARSCSCERRAAGWSPRTAGGSPPRKRVASSTPRSAAGRVRRLRW